MPEDRNNPDSTLREGYVTVNGVAHFYTMIGSGEPFVVLHGGPGMWHDELFPFFDNLASDHQVVFYDQRGNGKSSMDQITQGNFSVDWLVSDLEELRKAWGFDRINIVGHSWGGLLAMYYATEHPDRVTRLILIDPAPVNTDLLIRSYKALIDRFAENEWNHLETLYDSDIYLAGDPATHNEAMRLSEGAAFHVAEAREKYFDLVAFDAVTARNMVAISGPARTMKLNVTVQEKLKNITCPTLIIHGEKGFIVAGVSMAIDTAGSTVPSPINLAASATPPMTMSTATPRPHENEKQPKMTQTVERSYALRHRGFRRLCMSHRTP